MIYFPMQWGLNTHLLNSCNRGIWWQWIKYNGMLNMIHHVTLVMSNMVTKIHGKILPTRYKLRPCNCLCLGTVRFIFYELSWDSNIKKKYSNYVDENSKYKEKCWLNFIWESNLTIWQRTTYFDVNCHFLNNLILRVIC